MGSTLLCIVHLVPAVTQLCRRRLVCRSAATHRNATRAATKALTGLATRRLDLEFENVATENGLDRVERQKNYQLQSKMK